MKIKYIAGKKLNTEAEVDATAAQSLIDDGIAIEVKALDPVDAATAELEVKINEIATKSVANAVKNATKGLKNQIVVGSPNELDDETGGFKSMSHFLFEVSRSGTNVSSPTPLMTKYLKNVATKTAGPTGNTEGAPLTLTAGTTDGAVIPVEYVGEIFRMYGEQDDLMSLCFPFPMNSLSAHLPVLRNYDRSNTTATAGIVPVVSGEANIIAVSKTTWEQRLFTLINEKIMVPVSNEALDDNNVGLGAAIAAQAIWQLRKKINGKILNGSQTPGTDNSIGIIGNAATKIVGRAVNNQISFADVLKMYAAFAHQDANYNGAIWIGHPTIVSQVFTSTIGNFPAMIAPGGGKDGQPLTILGRPLVLTGWSQPLGTTGDLLLVDPKKYIMGYKGGVNSFVSPHVYAASDQTGFRFTQRVNGQPGLTGLITLEDGSNTVSPFVELGQVGGLS